MTSPVRAALSSFERISAVDGIASAVARLLRPVLGGALGDALRGSWLGHPVHPVLVTVPIGTWTAAPIFDLTRAPFAAQRLILIGIVAATPAAVTGLAEYVTLDTAARRVALIHAGGNTVSITLLARSMMVRRQGRRGAALGYTLAGLTATGFSGALGGHLSYVQGAGVARESRPSTVQGTPTT